MYNTNPLFVEAFFLLRRAVDDQLFAVVADDFAQPHEFQAIVTQLRLGRVEQGPVVDVWRVGVARQIAVDGFGAAFAFDPDRVGRLFAELDFGMAAAEVATFDLGRESVEVGGIFLADDAPGRADGRGVTGRLLGPAGVGAIERFAGNSIHVLAIDARVISGFERVHSGKGRVHGRVFGGKRGDFTGAKAKGSAIYGQTGLHQVVLGQKRRILLGNEVFSRHMSLLISGLRC